MFKKKIFLVCKKSYMNYKNYYRLSIKRKAQWNKFLMIVLSLLKKIYLTENFMQISKLKKL